jgi:hypothetical protein
MMQSSNLWWEDIAQVNAYMPKHLNSDMQSDTVPVVQKKEVVGKDGMKFERVYGVRPTRVASDTSG